MSRLATVTVVVSVSDDLVDENPAEWIRTQHDDIEVQFIGTEPGVSPTAVCLGAEPDGWDEED